VTDRNGHFVSGLEKDDFIVYEDGQLQSVSHFSNERVPVSLGIVLDTSGSMAGDKMQSAQSAIDRFLYDLLDPTDEIFVYAFNNEPELLQEWTTDRKRLSRAIGRLTPHGGTAMYDAVAEAVQVAQTGEHRKKAVVVISDGNDTSSHIGIKELKQIIRESEVLVYAIGIDGDSPATLSTGGGPVPRMPRFPFPFPVPGRRGPFPMPPIGGGTRGGAVFGGDQRVNVQALRELTDDTGGRTEIIRRARDLDPATASVADELSKQYYLGYPAAGNRDGRWHNIKVEVKDAALRVRARRGYIAS
jgi:Ca-activated chloride channel family protein